MTHKGLTVRRLPALVTSVVLLLGCLGLAAIQTDAAVATGTVSCFWPSSSGNPCSPAYSLLAGGGQHISGYIGNITQEPQMNNQTTGTAKRIERYQNGVGQTGAWNSDGIKDWTVGVVGSPSGGTAWLCHNRSTGSVNVNCKYTFN